MHILKTVLIAAILLLASCTDLPAPSPEKEAQLYCVTLVEASAICGLGRGTTLTSMYGRDPQEHRSGLAAQECPR